MMTWIFPFFSIFLIAFVVSFLSTWMVRAVAWRLKVVDVPDGSRKIHQIPISLWGGVALFLSFSMVASFYVFSQKYGLFGTGYIQERQFVGILFASFILMVGGMLDDRFNFSYRKQLVAPILAVIMVMIFGTNITVITNPLGGVFRLDQWSLKIPAMGLAVYSLPWLVYLVTFVWMFIMMYTTKLLDGLDGLVSGISVIGGMLLFFVSLRSDLLQYDTALLSLIFAGVCFGFLLWNFHPATIFLGEGGSLLCGFLLGVLSIIAGGKLTTTLLVMGIPMLDLLWVMIRRSLIERRSPFSHADQQHLHHRLLHAGLSHRQAVLLLYALSLGFGLSILFVQGSQKVVVLSLLFLVMILLGMILVRRSSVPSVKK